MLSAFCCFNKFNYLNNCTDLMICLQCIIVVGSLGKLPFIVCIVRILLIPVFLLYCKFYDLLYSKLSTNQLVFF